MKIDLKINYPVCSFPLIVDINNILFIGNVLPGSKGKSSLLQYVYVPCPDCGEYWFLPYYEFFALLLISGIY